MARIEQSDTTDEVGALRRALRIAADVAVRDERYLPIFVRLEKELERTEARIDALERARKQRNEQASYCWSARDLNRLHLRSRSSRGIA